MDLQILREVKKRKKMTLKDISIASGIPKRTVDDIFSGHTLNPRVETIEAIERALGMNNNDVIPAKYELSQKQLRLLIAFDNLLPDIQDNILNFLECLSFQLKELENVNSYKKI